MQLQSLQYYCLVSILIHYAKITVDTKKREEYIQQKQNTVAQYISPRSPLDLCDGLERALGERVGMRWWDQARINMAKSREAAAAETEKDGGEE